MNNDSLNTAPRLLLEVKIQPVQGTRFQPTGFPDLGAALYTVQDKDAPTGQTQMLLVESAQSMANRLEAICWDRPTMDWISPLKGLPYVAVINRNKAQITNSILEAHRLNSVYIKRSSQGRFHQILKEEISYEETRPIDYQKFVTALLKYDVNSLIHGVFLETIAGRLRIPRVLTAFIEARNAGVATSGGVKNDYLDPAKKIKLPPVDKGISTDSDDDRRGNVPYHRYEYTGEVTAFFNLDLAQLRGYGFEPAVNDLLVALALYKVRAFLDRGMRLRTACDFDVAGEIVVKKPTGFSLPAKEELEAALPGLIQAAKGYFADPARTDVTFEE